MLTLPIFSLNRVSSNYEIVSSQISNSIVFPTPFSCMLKNSYLSPSFLFREFWHRELCDSSKNLYVSVNRDPTFQLYHWPSFLYTNFKLFLKLTYLLKWILEKLVKIRSEHIETLAGESGLYSPVKTAKFHTVLRLYPCSMACCRYRAQSLKNGKLSFNFRRVIS